MSQYSFSLRLGVAMIEDLVDRHAESHVVSRKVASNLKRGLGQWCMVCDKATVCDEDTVALDASNVAHFSKASSVQCDL